MLKFSKTHSENRKPQLIKISNKSTNKNVATNTRPRIYSCPYTAVRNYLNIRPSCTKPSEPFFIFCDRAPVLPLQFRTMLRTLLTTAGFQANLYSRHSFRIGRSVDLYKMGVSVETIKKLGHWRSNCVYSYLSHT